MIPCCVAVRGRRHRRVQVLFLTLPQMLQGGKDAAGVGRGCTRSTLAATRRKITQDGLNKDGTLSQKSFRSWDFGRGVKDLRLE